MDRERTRTVPGVVCHKELRHGYATVRLKLRVEACIWQICRPLLSVKLTCEIIHSSDSMERKPDKNCRSHYSSKQALGGQELPKLNIPCFMQIKADGTKPVVKISMEGTRNNIFEWMKKRTRRRGLYSKFK